MKLLGCILVAGSALWLGLRAGRELRARARGLEEIAAALRLLEQELEFAGPELGVLTRTVAQRSDGAGRALFEGFGENLRRLGERRVSELWGEAVDVLPRLPEEGRVLLRSLGESLGRYDAGAQCRDIAGVRARLEGLREREAEMYREKSRLYRTLSLSGGLFLVILLI